jgi:hypothetical protein
VTCATLALAALLAARGPIPFQAEIDAALAETSAIYPVPKALVVAVISVESSFRPRAVSRAGAKGLMQLMPYTARRVGIGERELFDPRRNVLGGVRLLAVLLRHYEGDVISALVAYNARPRRLFAPMPRNGETPAYVWKVLAVFRQLAVIERTATAATGPPTALAVRSELPCVRCQPRRVHLNSDVVGLGPKSEPADGSHNEPPNGGDQGSNNNG